MSSSDSEESALLTFHEPYHRSIIRKFRTIPNFVFVTILAVIVGIGAGFGALFTEWLVEEVHHIFFEKKLWGLLESLGMFHLMVIPAIGALIFAPIIILFAREAKGHGVSEVLEAVSVHGGRIRPRVGIIKSLTSALCIGTGVRLGLKDLLPKLVQLLVPPLGNFFLCTKIEFVCY